VPVRVDRRLPIPPSIPHDTAVRYSAVVDERLIDPIDAVVFPVVRIFESACYEDAVLSA